MVANSDKTGNTEDANDFFLRKFQKELNSGTLSLVLLAVTDQAKEDLYGYQIAKLLETASGGEALFKQGALYPVLRGLRSNGLLSSRVEPSSSGPPRRYYRITEQGRKTLTAWQHAWRTTRNFVDKLMNSEDLK